MKFHNSPDPLFGRSRKKMRNRFSVRLLPLFLVLFISGAFTVSAQDMMNGPPIPLGNNGMEQYGKGRNTFLNFYQKWISPVKGGNKCPMHPSCSQYSKMAFDGLPKHLAYIRSCERILRCGNELYLYSTIEIDGITRWHDPLIMKRNIQDDAPAFNDQMDDISDGFIFQP
jgi:putative component of membrane protein insertase Oxa1/YidC/SpoIIIJ protein YidD